MELRNLKRFLLTAKVLRKYNKKQRFEITQKRLSILLTVHHMNKNNMKTSFSSVLRQYNDLGHSDSWKNVVDTLDQLSAANYLETYYRTLGGRQVKQYRITPTGILLLTTLEKQLRQQRFDR